MTHHDDTTIRRRADGSIDTEFYVRRGARLRRAAMRKAPAHWVGNLAQATAKLFRIPSFWTRSFGARHHSDIALHLPQQGRETTG